MKDILYQVHLVPTEERSPLVLNNIEKGLFIVGGQGILAKHRMGNCTNQHLYITSNEEIKEGDWYLFFNSPTSIEVRQDNNDAHGMCSCRKIVATTNPELWKHGKLIYSLENGIPKIDQQFIELYIKRYNEGNPIKEVKLEYIFNSKKFEYSSITTDTKAILKLTQEGAVIPIIEEEKMYSREEVLNILLAWDRYTTLNTPLVLKNWFNKTYSNT